MCFCLSKDLPYARKIEKTNSIRKCSFEPQKKEKKELGFIAKKEARAFNL